MPLETTAVERAVRDIVMVFKRLHRQIHSEEGVDMASIEMSFYAACKMYGIMPSSHLAHTEGSGVGPDRGRVRASMTSPSPRTPAAPPSLSRRGPRAAVVCSSPFQPPAAQAAGLCAPGPCLPRRPMLTSHPVDQRGL